MPTQTNQSAKHANVIAALGTSATGYGAFAGYSYESAWEALFDGVRAGVVDAPSVIPAGPFNQRFLAWINLELMTSYTNLPRAMQAFAEDRGAYDWDSLDDLDL